MPEYSCIVSIMSSISLCSAAAFSSCLSIGRAVCRSTGCPIRATFRMDIGGSYTVVSDPFVHSHDLTPPYRFCPVCASALESRVLKVTEPKRLVCTNTPCGFVFYLDPKIAVGTVIRLEDGPATDRAAGGIVLVRRAIEPGYGKWVFPGGYVDRGEEITLAAIREAREESGLDVRIDRLINIYSYAGRAPIVVVYAATCVGGE